MKRAVISFCTAVLFILGCSKDENTIICNGETPSYTDTIKTVIDKSCAVVGCHGTGSEIGDFSKYDGLKPYLDDGHFEHHVLKKQDMPPSAPLSDAELSLIQCWLENEYAE